MAAAGGAGAVASAVLFEDDTRVCSRVGRARDATKAFVPDPTKINQDRGFWVEMPSIDNAVGDFPEYAVLAILRAINDLMEKGWDTTSLPSYLEKKFFPGGSTFEAVFIVPGPDGVREVMQVHVGDSSAHLFLESSSGFMMYPPLPPHLPGFDPELGDSVRQFRLVGPEPCHFTDLREYATQQLRVRRVEPFHDSVAEKHAYSLSFDPKIPLERVNEILKKFQPPNAHGSRVRMAKGLMPSRTVGDYTEPLVSRNAQFQWWSGKDAINGAETSLYGVVTSDGVSDILHLPTVVEYLLTTSADKTDVKALALALVDGAESIYYHTPECINTDDMTAVVHAVPAGTKMTGAVFFGVADGHGLHGECYAELLSQMCCCVFPLLLQVFVGDREFGTGELEAAVEKMSLPGFATFGATSSSCPDLEHRVKRLLVPLVRGYFSIERDAYRRDANSTDEDDSDAGSDADGGAVSAAAGGGAAAAAAGAGLLAVSMVVRPAMSACKPDPAADDPYPDS